MGKLLHYLITIVIFFTIFIIIISLSYLWYNDKYIDSNFCNFLWSPWSAVFHCIKFTKFLSYNPLFLVLIFSILAICTLNIGFNKKIKLNKAFFYSKEILRGYIWSMSLPVYYIILTVVFLTWVKSIIYYIVLTVIVGLLNYLFTIIYYNLIPYKIKILTYIILFIVWWTEVIMMQDSLILINYDRFVKFWL